MEVVLEPGFQAVEGGDERAVAAGRTKRVGPGFCEEGRVYLFRDRAAVGRVSGLDPGALRAPIAPRSGLLQIGGMSTVFCRSGDLAAIGVQRAPRLIPHKQPRAACAAQSPRGRGSYRSGYEHRLL